jgi:hypothetical protein
MYSSILYLEKLQRYYPQKVKLPLCRSIISTIKIMSVTLGLKHSGKHLLGPKEEVNRGKFATLQLGLYWS